MMFCGTDGNLCVVFEVVGTLHHLHRVEAAPGALAEALCFLADQSAAICQLDFDLQQNVGCRKTWHLKGQ